MHLTQFPDIEWLRTQAKNNFQNGKGVNNSPLAQKGWPSVVLNTNSYGAERNGIKGPFSIFLNLTGSSIVKSGHKSVKLTADNLCIVNKGDFYDLTIPEGSRTDTFNIHFGDQLYNEVLKLNSQTTAQLLDNPISYSDAHIESPTRSVWKTDQVNQHILSLQQYYASDDKQEDNEYSLLGSLLSTILGHQHDDVIKRDQIDSQKKATRLELLSRISSSVDYIHAHYNETINLDTLAAVACLSKYHYLRTFKAIHNCTPQQLVAQLRFEKAVSMLKHSKAPIMEIAPLLGFSEIAAFTRFFRKISGQAPSTLRKSS